MPGKDIRAWVSGKDCGSGELPPPDAERHVERHRPTLEQDRERIAFLHVPGEALEVRHRANVLAVELLDDVASLDARLRRRAAVLDADHDDPFGRPQVELARDFGCHGPHFEPEHRARTAATRPLLLGLALVGRLPDLDLDDLLSLIAPDLDLRGAVGREESDGAL